jgi:hypothetical protein
MLEAALPRTCRISGAADAVAAHDDIAGAEDVDGVAVLAGATGDVVDILDAVVDDERTVVALLRPVHQNAAVAGAAHDVILDRQAARIERIDCNVRGLGDGGAGHRALDLKQTDTAAARTRDLAIHDAKVAALFEDHQSAVLRQRPATALDGETRERDVIAATCRNQRGTAGEDEPRRAAHANQLGAARQRKPANAVIAGTKHQGHAGARGLVDRRLQHVALVGAAAGAHAELRRINAERGKRRRTGRSGQTCSRHGARECRDDKKTTAIDLSCPAPIENSEQTIQVSGQEKRAVMAHIGPIRAALTLSMSRNGKRTRASARRQRIDIDPFGRLGRCSASAELRRLETHHRRRIGRTHLFESFEKFDADLVFGPHMRRGSGGARRHRSSTPG